jgi:hypothetical protein
MATVIEEPRDRFAAELAAIRRRIDDLPDGAVQTVLAELEGLRRRVLTELVDALPDTYDQARLTQLEASIRRIMLDFVDRYGRDVTEAQLISYGLGADLAARPLQAAGLNVHTPMLSRRQIEAMQGYQAQLITNATERTIGEISTVLRAGLLRGDRWPDIMALVAPRLTEPGPFGSLAARAEAITRTELGRIQALATQASLEQMQRLVPDMQKEWKHSRNTGKDARLGHIDAEGQIRDVADTFRVRPGPGYPYEELMYPRDPAATPRSVVNCGCVVVPFRKAWAEFEREQQARRTLVPA